MTAGGEIERVEGAYPVLGLTGLPGAGKTEVARLVAAYGAHVVDVDSVGHEILTDASLCAALVQRFGDTVLDADARIDRKRLGAIVFADETALAALEAIVHPPMREQVWNIVQTKRVDGCVVIDAALLFEMKLEEMCDAVWLVDAPFAVRCQRTAARGWTPEEVQRREQRLFNIDELRCRVDRVLDNHGNRTELEELVYTYWKEFLHAT